MPPSEGGLAVMAGRPRVLLHAFSTFKTGGPQVRFVQLANTFADQGLPLRHVIAAMDGNFAAAERLAPNVAWERLEVDNRRGGLLANRGTFRALLQSHRPDLLLSYNWGAIEWIAGNVPRVVPQVHVEDGFNPEEVQRQLPRRVWTRRVLFTAGGVRVLVPSQRLHTLAPGWWVPPARLAFVPNGVTLPPVPVWQAPRSGEPITIGTVAALRAEKNLPRLLRAVAALRGQWPLRLLIVGDGPVRPALEALAAELGLAQAVTFTGHMADPSPAFARMHAFALSSDTEQLPIAVLEAMAHGLPVVATAVGDVPLLTPPAAQAWLSAPDDAAYTAALGRALADSAAWATAGEQGRALVARQYDRRRMEADWRTVFEGGWPQAPR